MEGNLPHSTQCYVLFLHLFPKLRTFYFVWISRKTTDLKQETENSHASWLHGKTFIIIVKVCAKLPSSDQCTNFSWLIWIFNGEWWSKSLLLYLNQLEPATRESTGKSNLMQLSRGDSLVSWCLQLNCWFYFCSQLKKDPLLLDLNPEARVTDYHYCGFSLLVASDEPKGYSVYIISPRHKQWSRKILISLSQ
jgi:hypothetical protein